MQVTKRGTTREIRPNQLERHLRNGWRLVEEGVTATLVAPQANTEPEPAVGTEPEQGENYDSEGEN